jgi:molybdate transport system substrate-binding protein
MSRRSALVITLFVVSALMPKVSGAAEIKLLSANVFTGVLDGPIRDFERASGHNVVIIYGTAGNIKSRIQSGEPGDVTIVTKPMMDELEKSGKIAPGTRVDIARSAVAVIVRKGASKPDIGSVDALKHSLLAARSISYPDPSHGGATGVLFTGLLERLDLAAAMKTKTKFPAADGFAVELVAKGDAELAIAQPMEALLQPGVEIVGLLPSELQSPPNFTFVVGQMARAKESDAAHSFIQFLIGPAVQAVLKSKGMEPGAEK